MKKEKWHRRLFPILAAAALCAMLTACGSGNGIFGAKSTTVAETAAGGVQMNRMPSSHAMKAEEGLSDMAAETNGTDSGLTSSTQIQPVPTGRKLIRTVHLSVETMEFDQLIGNINQAVSDAGGYMESSDVSGTSISDSLGRRYAYLTVRVPADKLDHFISLVGEQSNITSKSETTQDVTLQYSDIESRKKSLLIEQDRLWELLEKADTMESIIALEDRLSEIRYQLESFESQLRTYDNQVDYSTVYINIDEVKVLTPTSPDSVGTRIQKGFQRNLETVCDNIVNFFVWFLSSLPSLAMLAVIVILIAVILRMMLRFLRGRKTRRHADKASSNSQASPDSASDEAASSSQTGSRKHFPWSAKK